MRIFFDTNVLLSGFLWSGTSAEAIRRATAAHERMTGEFVLQEARRILTDKFAVPAADIAEFEAEVRSYHVQPLPESPWPSPLVDPDDGWVLASALEAGAEVLVTGDKDLLSIHGQVAGLRIITPRQLLDLLPESS